MEAIDKDLRWDVAVAVVREMIRCRRSQPLSEAVIQTDPDGTLVLTRHDYDHIVCGMTADEAVSIIGTQPHRDGHSQNLKWFTMGGSFVDVTINQREQKVIGKSFSNVIARACKVESFCGNDWPPQSGSARSPWPTISTAQIGKFFLKHSNQQQRRWFQGAMSGAVQFEIEKVGDRPSIQFNFDREEPGLWDTPTANHLTDVQAERFWQAVLQLGSSRACRDHR